MSASVDWKESGDEEVKVGWDVRLDERELVGHAPEELNGRTGFRHLGV